MQNQFKVGQEVFSIGYNMNGKYVVTKLTILQLEPEVVVRSGSIRIKLQDTSDLYLTRADAKKAIK